MRTGVSFVPLVVLLVFVALMAPVSAEPVGMLMERAEEKAGEAGADPMGFAQDHASQNGLERESGWTQAYACFVLRETERESGADSPELGVCPAFEAVVEQDPIDEDLDAAAARPLDETGAVVGDARGTLDEVLRDPENAPGALVGFLERTGAAAQRMVDGLVDLVVSIVRDLLVPMQMTNAAGIKQAAEGLVWVVMLPVKTGEWAVEGALDSFDRSLHAAGMTLKATQMAASSAQASAMEAVTAVASFGTGMLETVQGWFTVQPEGDLPRALPEKDLLDAQRPDKALLRDVEDLLPDL